MPSYQPVMLGPVPVDFILFALVLLGIAFLQCHTSVVAVTGLYAVTVYKLFISGFAQGAGLSGLMGLFAHEWVILANLFGLLMGFALLSKHFEDSNVPVVLPRILPGDWKGGFLLLVMVFVLSSFLDNIAAALIGGTMASAVFRKKVHIGYLAAIVAASNGGGSGSVVGDTTTTMMWIAGVDPLDVLEGFVGARAALAIFGVIAARQQQADSPIMKDPPAGVRVDWARVGIVAFILVVAIVANVVANLEFPQVLDVFPVIGAAVWVAILASAPFRKADWTLLPATFQGTMFLLALVTTAAMMPVEKLPPAAWPTPFRLRLLPAAVAH